MNSRRNKRWLGHVSLLFSPPTIVQRGKNILEVLVVGKRSFRLSEMACVPYVLQSCFAFQLTETTINSTSRHNSIQIQINNQQGGQSVPAETVKNSWLLNQQGGGDNGIDLLFQVASFFHVENNVIPSPQQVYFLQWQRSNI